MHTRSVLAVNCEPSREGLGDYVRTIGRMAVRLTLSLGFLVCLTLVGASGAGAQTCPGSGSGSGSGSGAVTCDTTTTAPIVAGSTTSTDTGLALTGEQAAIPLAAAAGLMIIVLGARQLRRRANN